MYRCMYAYVCARACNPRRVTSKGGRHREAVWGRENERRGKSQIRVKKESKHGVVIKAFLPT